MGEGFTRSLERFQTGASSRNYGKFPEKYSTHVHQICLTYLVDSAPYQLGLGGSGENADLRHSDLEIRKVASLASQSPIPLNLFDTLLLLVLEDLYAGCYPSFVSSFRLSQGALDHLAEREELDYRLSQNGLCIDPFQGSLDYSNSALEGFARDRLPRGEMAKPNRYSEGHLERPVELQIDRNRFSHPHELIFSGDLLADGDTRQELQVSTLSRLGQVHQEDYPSPSSTDFPMEYSIPKSKYSDSPDTVHDYPLDFSDNYRKQSCNDLTEYPQGSLLSHTSMLMAAMEEAVYSDIELSESISYSRMSSVNHSRMSSLRDEDVAPWDVEKIQPPTLRSSLTSSLSALSRQESQAMQAHNFQANSNRNLTHSHLARSRLEQNRLNAKLASFTAPPLTMLKSPSDLEIMENLDFNTFQKRASQISVTETCEELKRSSKLSTVGEDSNQFFRRSTTNFDSLYSNITVSSPKKVKPLQVKTSNITFTSHGLLSPLPSGQTDPGEFDIEAYYLPSAPVAKEKRGKWKSTFKTAIKGFFTSH